MYKQTYIVTVRGGHQPRFKFHHLTNGDGENKYRNVTRIQILIIWEKWAPRSMIRDFDKMWQKFCACPIKHSSKSISGNIIKNAVYKRRNKKVAKTRKTKKNAINSMGTPKFMIIKRNYKFNSIFNFRMILMAGATYRFIIGHFPITTILLCIFTYQ